MMKITSRAENRIAVNVAAVLAGTLMFPVVVMATDVHLAADVGVGTSDNILRVPANERSETIEQVGLQFSVQHQGPRLTTDLRGDLAYLNYDRNTFSSELVGNAGAAFRLDLIEDRLSWSLDDVFGQTRRDPYTVVTPLNRENVNYFSTGPNLLLHIGSASRLLAYARYGRVSYETNLYDTERYSAQAGIEHDLSATGHLSFNLSEDRVDPLSGGTLLSAYDRQQAFVRYRLESARIKAVVDLGASRVDRNGSASNGTIARLNLVRQFSERSTIILKVGRQVTDSGDSLAWSGGTPLPTSGLDTQSLARTASPFTSTYADLGWQLTGRRTRITLGGGVYEENHGRSSSGLDRKRYVASVSADRDLSPRLIARGRFVYNKYDYLNIDFDNSEKTYELGLQWRAGRHISLDLSAQKASFIQPLLGDAVNETRLWFKLKYAR